VYFVFISTVADTSKIEHEAQLIHYITPLRWELLIYNLRICRSDVEAMEDLSGCRYEMGSARVGMYVSAWFEDDET
jgi:hypothetical protein